MEDFLREQRRIEELLARRQDPPAVRLAQVPGPPVAQTPKVEDHQAYREAQTTPAPKALPKPANMLGRQARQRQRRQRLAEAVLKLEETRRKLATVAEGATKTVAEAAVCQAEKHVRNIENSMRDAQKAAVKDGFDLEIGNTVNPACTPVPPKANPAPMRSVPGGSQQHPMPHHRGPYDRPRPNHFNRMPQYYNPNSHFHPGYYFQPQNIGYPRPSPPPQVTSFRYLVYRGVYFLRCRIFSVTLQFSSK